MKVTNLFLLLGVIAMLVLAGCSNSNSNLQGDNTDTNSEVINIGFIGPLTGDIPVIGEGKRLMVELAAEEINSEGGIDGKRVNVIYEDAYCKSKGGTDAANKLINVDRVNYILGGSCSPETLAAAPIAEENHVILMSDCSTSPDVTNAGDYIFRVIPSDAYQGKVAAEHAFNNLGVRKVAIMACLNEWCQGLQDVFTETFETLGGEIVEVQNFEPDSSDLRTELLKVKEANPDLVYIPTFIQSSTAILKQMQELGMNKPVLGGDVWADNTLWQNVGQPSFKTQFLMPKSETPEDLNANFKARFGQDKEITFCALQAYDVMKIYAKVISEVGDNPEAVKNALYNMPEYQGASGPIEFDQNGDVKKAVYSIMEVQNGEAIEIAVR